MKLALTLDDLKRETNTQYGDTKKCIVGIMLARYDISLTQNIVNDCFHYWHYNTGKTLDIFWAGYGAYLAEEDQTNSKLIMNFHKNYEREYFDLKAFISIKNALNKVLEKRYKDHVQLILINYENGELKFDSAIQIDLEENIDENYSTIRELIEWITYECHSTYNVRELNIKLKSKKFYNDIKSISFVDVAGMVLGVSDSLI